MSRYSTTTNDDDSILFQRSLNVRLLDSSTSSSSSYSEKSLIFKFERISRSADLRREKLSLKILDENDIFFIYHYVIDSQEFERIKIQQKLLISFESFPNQMVGFLQDCDSTGHDPPKFVLNIRNKNSASLQLEIVQLSEFRHISVLNLTIPAASEEYVRSNYKTNYRKLQSQNNELLRTIGNLEDEINSLTLSKSKDLQALNKNYQDEKESYEYRIDELIRQSREEKDKYFESEKIFKSKITKLQLENSTKDEIIDKLERQAKETESDLRERFKSELLKKNTKISELDSTNKELIEDLQHQKELRDITNEQLNSLKNEFDIVRKDLTKANDIIRKLLTEVKNNRDKVGILNKVTHKQEDQIEIKESTVEKLTSDMKVCLQQIKIKNKKIDDLEDEIINLKSQISQSDLQMMAYKKVINSLTKELEQQNKLNSQLRMINIDDVNEGDNYKYVKISPKKKKPEVSQKQSTSQQGQPQQQRHQKEQKKPEEPLKLKHVNYRSADTQKNRNVLSFI